MKRRSFNKKAIIASAWVAPTVSMVSLPSHAQATQTPSPVATETPSPLPTEPLCLTCSENRYVAVPVGARSPAGVDPGIVGPEGSFSLENVCIGNLTNTVKMVSTGNNPFETPSRNFLGFDEAMVITVTRPDGTTASAEYATFDDPANCTTADAIIISGQPTEWDISELFQDASGNFIPGNNYMIRGLQCNSVQRWTVRSFDFLVDSDACP